MLEKHTAPHKERPFTALQVLVIIRGVCSLND